MSYYRIHSEEIAFLTQKPRGVFTSVGRLVEAKILTEREVEQYWENRSWLEKTLPVPPFYVDGNPERAITWFKDGPRAQLIFAQISFYLDMARKYGLFLYRTETDLVPGRIVYEDEYQIAVADSLHGGAAFLTTPLA